MQHLDIHTCTWHVAPANPEHGPRDNKPKKAMLRPKQTNCVSRTINCLTILHSLDPSSVSISRHILTCFQSLLLLLLLTLQDLVPVCALSPMHGS